MKTPGPKLLSARWRGFLSVLLALHVLAVIVAPFSVDSLLGQVAVRYFYRPYLNAAYLNHGYHFFGPEPGPSHLVRYEVKLPDGSVRQGIFPDGNEHWPRLLYHRHFMLSERLSPAPPETPDAVWKQAYARSYARHLLHRYNAEQVTLYLRRHLLASPYDVLEGGRLDDPKLFLEERILVMKRSGHDATRRVEVGP